MCSVHLHKHLRLVYVSPEADADAFTFYIYSTVVETEPLFEVGAAERLSFYVQTEASCLEQSVVLVEHSAFGNIEENVAVLHPHVHSHIVTAARHRTG